MIKIRRGLDLPLSGAPQQSIDDAAAVSQVAAKGPRISGGVIQHHVEKLACLWGYDL